MNTTTTITISFSLVLFSLFFTNSTNKEILKKDSKVFLFGSSLSHAHLKQDPNEPKPSFSILVIGTHLDHESVKKDQQNKQEREEQVKKLAKESGISVRIEYKEVSCATMENMKDLEESICRLALGHSYMGERIPKSYH